MSRLLYILFLVFSLCTFSLPEFGGILVPSFLSLAWTLLALGATLRAARSGSFSVPGIFPLVLLSSYIAVQLIPLPPALVEFLSPQKAELYRETVWVFSPGLWMTLSNFPEKTLLEFLQAVSFIGLYWIAVQFLTDRNRIRRAGVILLTAAGVQSVIVLFLSMAPREMLLDFSPILFRLSSDIQEGPSAGFLVTIIPVALGLIMTGRPQVRYFPLRERIIQFFRFPGSMPHILYTVPTILILVSVFLMPFRYSLLALVAALLIFGIAFLIQGPDRWGELPMVGCLILLGTFAFAAGEAGVFNWREDRVPTLLLASVNSPEIENFADLPTSSRADDKDRENSDLTLEMPDSVRVTESSYDPYLGANSQNGLAGGICLTIFIVALLWKTYPAWRRRKNRIARFLYPGAVAGLLVGFGITVVGESMGQGRLGYGILFLASLAVSAAHTHSRGANSTELQEGKSGKMAAWAGILVLFCLLDAWLIAGSVLRSQSVASGEKSVIKEYLISPLDAQRHVSDFEIRMKEGNVPGAETSLRRMLQLNPGGGEYLRLAGAFRDRQGNNDAAEALYRRSVLEEKPGSPLRKGFIAWLFSRGRDKEGIKELRNELSMFPEITASYLPLLTSLKSARGKIGEILPERFMAYIHYGDFLAKKGKVKAAEKYYKGALALAPEEVILDSAPFLQIYGRFMERGNYEEALNAITLGIGKFPGDAELRRSAAVLYERMGLTYRAVEEYRHALLLEPGHEGVRKSLERLTE